jgi:hypothetical protein
MLPDHAPARPLDSKEEALEAVSYRGGPHVNDMRVHAHAHVSHGETAPFALSWRAHTDIRNGHQKRLLDTPFPLRGVREVPRQPNGGLRPRAPPAQIGYWKPPLPPILPYLSISWRRRRCFSLGRLAGGARAAARRKHNAEQMGRQTEFVFLALVICALMLSSSLQPRGSPNRPVAVTPSAQLQPPEPVQPPRMSTGQQPGSGGSGDATSSHSVAAGGQQKRLRVRLIMLVVNIFPVRRCGKRPPRARANSPRSTPRQRQSKLRAASSLGQPWPICSCTCVLAETHTRPAFRLR